MLEKWARCQNVISKIPDEAFSVEQRPWLASLINDYMSYSSLALCVADGLITSRQVLLEELEQEFRKELLDETVTDREEEEGPEMAGPSIRAANAG